jgi:Family of unknown function (DUF5320)
MPGGDRTGPQGLGPRSGGRRGRCAGTSGQGNGAGKGNGGFGRFRGVVGVGKPDEATLLKGKIADAEETLVAMKERLGAISKDDR